MTLGVTAGPFVPSHEGCLMFLLSQVTWCENVSCLNGLFWCGTVCSVWWTFLHFVFPYMEKAAFPASTTSQLPSSEHSLHCIVLIRWSMGKGTSQALATMPSPTRPTPHKHICCHFSFCWFCFLWIYYSSPGPHEKINSVEQGYFAVFSCQFS